MHMLVWLQAVVFSGESSPTLAVHAHDAGRVRPDQFSVGVVVGRSAVALVPDDPVWRRWQAVGVVVRPKENDFLEMQQRRWVKWFAVSDDLREVAVMTGIVTCPSS